jgi:uncharacterized membrane protein YgcG
MTRNWDERDARHFEAALRRARPQPSRELEDLLLAYVAAQRPRRIGARLRLAIAAILSAALLVGLGSLVGVGLAASGPSQLVAAVAKVVQSSTSSQGAGQGDNNGAGGGNNGGGNGNGGGNSDHQDPSDDQYKPGKGCGDENHVHARENQCKTSKG